MARLPRHLHIQSHRAMWFRRLYVCGQPAPSQSALGCHIQCCTTRSGDSAVSAVIGIDAGCLAGAMQARTDTPIAMRDGYTLWALDASFSNLFLKQELRKRNGDGHCRHCICARMTFVASVPSFRVLGTMGLWPPSSLPVLQPFICWSTTSITGLPVREPLCHAGKRNWRSCKEIHRDLLCRSLGRARGQSARFQRF